MSPVRLTGALVASAAQFLFPRPGDQGALGLVLRPARDLRHHRPSPAGAHQVPHGRDRRLAATLVGRMAVVGHEMEIATAIVDVMLLDLIAAHNDLADRDPGVRRVTHP